MLRSQITTKLPGSFESSQNKKHNFSIKNINNSYDDGRLQSEGCQRFQTEAVVTQHNQSFDAIRNHQTLDSTTNGIIGNSSIDMPNASPDKGSLMKNSQKNCVDQCAISITHGDSLLHGNNSEVKDNYIQIDSNDIDLSLNRLYDYNPEEDTLPTKDETLQTKDFPDKESLFAKSKLLSIQEQFKTVSTTSCNSGLESVSHNKSNKKTIKGDCNSKAYKTESVIDLPPDHSKIVDANNIKKWLKIGGSSQSEYDDQNNPIAPCDLHKSHDNI